MAREDLDTLRDAYSAMARRDAEALTSVVAHDIEWTMPETLPWGGTRHGPDGIEAMVEIFADHVEGAWADPDDFLDAGDRVVVTGRLRGTVRGTGDDYEVPFAHVWGLSDGVPSTFHAYLDTAPILAALGLEPSS